MTRAGLPKYVYRVRGALRFQRRGWPSHTFVCQDQHNPGFYTEYLSYLNAAALPRGRDTYAELIVSYRMSDRFTGLAPRTRRDYAKHLAYLEERIGGHDPRATTRRDVNVIREGSMTASRFNYLLAVLRVLHEHAIDIGLRPDNPAKGVRKRKVVHMDRQPWPDDLIAAFREAADHKTLLLFELLLGTGQRIGDVLKMQWGDYRDGVVYVRQGKTGTKLEIPATARLRAMLDAEPRRALTIVTGRDGGRPWSYRGAAQAMMRVRQLIGAEAYDQHALRYTAAAELAGLGLDDATIAAVTGHQSLRMVAKYAGVERQRMRARIAQEKRR